MHQLANRLRELHALGYVNRDLQPGSVMWLPLAQPLDHHQLWLRGSNSSAWLGFSITYGAPKVIEAYHRGDDTMVAQVRSVA